MDIMISLMSLLALVSTAMAHSWIACSDYRGKNEGNWDATKCHGFPRDAATYANKNAFGLDRGFDHKPGNDGAACKTGLSGGSYGPEYPMAVYYQGQQAVLAHPMKNHGAASCTNIHIPDFGNRIYRGQRWTSVDSPKDTNNPYSYYKQFLVADLGLSPVGKNNVNPDSYPKPGFQNAPNFCGSTGTDKAFGSYSFNVPSDLPTGYYTFVWRWSFNGPTDIYTTCFDVQIVPTIQDRNGILLNQLPAADVRPICGGKLSNEGAGSMVGCNGVTAAPPPVTQPPPLTEAPPATDGNVVIVPTQPTQRPQTPQTQKPQTPKPSVIGGALAAKAFQIAGEFDLPISEVQDVSVRYATVMFECEVEAMFWNARVVGIEDTATGKIFQLVQESEADVLSRKIFFSSMFSDSCDLLKYPPIANLVKDEK